MIVPGGGLSMDGSRWVSCKPNFFLPVRVRSKLFRRLMLEQLAAVHAAGKLQFFGVHAHLADAKAFAAFLAPLTKTLWLVYAKRPFAGPKAVLAYLSRYTHRVAISNSRLIKADAASVTFKVKNYRVEGPARYTNDARHQRVHPTLPHSRASEGSIASAITGSSPVPLRPRASRQRANSLACLRPSSRPPPPTMTAFTIPTRRPRRAPAAAPSR
jgi:hypothetical protein